MMGGRALAEGAFQCARRRGDTRILGVYGQAIAVFAMWAAIALVAAALVTGSLAAGANAAAAPVATEISAAGDHACALLSDGTAKCWGANGHGQLGTGTRSRSLTARSVQGLTDAKAISTGWGASCALIAGGTVECWGDNSHGQLGDGTRTSRLTPVPVGGLGEAVAVAVAGWNACALLADHTVRCWGDNTLGGLGNGTRTSSPTPVPVSGLTDVTALSYGEQHGCALLSGGSVACWGWNGLLGNTPEARARDHLTPVGVAGVSGAVTVVANAYNDCVVLARGVVKCWHSYSKPAVVRGFQHVRAYTWTTDGQQGAHACALLRGDTVKCHGTATTGQLGNGSRRQVKEPVMVRGVRARMVSAGDLYTCALLAGGGVKCWGWNRWGQLGDGTTRLRLRPVSVRGLRRG
jgi:alpha-tubulin suppressor-like RCC1 family protein